LVLTRFDAKPGEPEVLQLQLRDIADGRLVLNDDLIRETLRAAKAARDAAGLEEDADEADDVAEEAPPSKGPGRFALRNAIRQPKSRPVLPAGVRTGFKAKPKTAGPQTNGARKPPR
jgi:ribosome maturation factor RimP